MKSFRKPIFAAVLGIVLYFIATNAGAGWLYVVSATIAAVIAVSALVPWWNVRGIQTSRKAPVVAIAGEPFEGSLELKNTGRLARHLLEVKDDFAGDVGRAVSYASVTVRRRWSGTGSRTRHGASTRAGRLPSNRGRRSACSSRVERRGSPRTSWCTRGRGRSPGYPHRPS